MAHQGERNDIWYYLTRIYGSTTAYRRIRRVHDVREFHSRTHPKEEVMFGFIFMISALSLFLIISVRAILEATR